MTKFITYYNLCPIHDPKEFLGIAADRDEGNVITTLGKNIVMVIKITTQKQIRSWSVLEKLSSKVIYDHRSEKYVGVFANRALRCWDITTTDVNKCKKLKFQKTIVDLIAVGMDTLVLYSDGTCERLAAAIESRKEEVLTPSEQLNISTTNYTFTNPTISTLSDGRQILTYFQRKKDTEDVVLVRLPLQDDNISPKRFIVKRKNLDVHVAGFAVIEGDDGPMMLTIWSDKRIFLLSLHDSVEPESSPGNFVSMISALKVDSPLSVLGISRHFVAIYGANHGQEGASLLLYNTQFKVVKAKQYFKVYFDFSRLWAANEHILLAMGQNLSVVSYRMCKESLAELVGTQTNNDFQTLVEGDHINEEDDLQQCLQFTSTHTSSNASETENSNGVAAVTAVEVADGKFVPFEAVHDFDRTLNALGQLQLHVEVIEEERPLEDINITLMSNYNDDALFTREVELIARQLERCGASEHEITEKLLIILIKSNQLQDIVVCLRRYSNVSEKMLAKTLKYILNNCVSTAYEPQPQINGEPEQMDVELPMDGEIGKNHTAEFQILDIFSNKYVNLPVPVAMKYNEVLNVVLSCTFDPEAIVVHIRREIDYPQVLILLQHLYNMLVDPKATFEEHPSFDQNSFQFEMQAMRWFGVLLNTHFQKLALAKDVCLIELLLKWHELLCLYKREIIELEQVAALLYNIVQRHKIFKEKNSSKWYSIEEVILY